jgi:hypothetical protein
VTVEPNWLILELRHAVAAAGRVLDAVTGKPLAGALVEITAGPPEFEQFRAILAQDPAWTRRRERPDRTHSRTDGIFVFLNLPPGEYRLRISYQPQAEGLPPVVRPAAGAGGYASSEVAATVFDGRDAAGRVRVDALEVKLAPTRLHGRVTRRSDSEAIVGAKVRLRGDYRTLTTDVDGRYEFTRLVATRLIVEASAPGFVAATSDPVAITPGGDHVADFALEAE